MKAGSTRFAPIRLSGRGPSPKRCKDKAVCTAEHQCEGGDECLSDRLLRVIDAKRTASKEANAQILALICDKYDDF